MMTSEVGEKLMSDLQTMIGRVREAVADHRLGIIDRYDVDLVVLEAQGAIMRVRSESRAAAGDAENAILELLGHHCEWNDDDYCNTCGTDGRA
jgi:hypothetical protein